MIRFAGSYLSTVVVGAERKSVVNGMRDEGTVGLVFEFWSAAARLDSGSGMAVGLWWPGCT